MCGNGHGVFGENSGMNLLFLIHMIHLMDGKTKQPQTAFSVCSATAPSSTAKATSAAPRATGTTPAAVAAAGVFVFFCSLYSSMVDPSRSKESLNSEASDL